jgi:Ca2+-binding RTX toxin-like protein
MKGKALLLVGTMTLALVLVGGVALADNIICTPNTRCDGTPQDDFITGTNDLDVIDALAGDDVVNAEDGADIVDTGDGEDFVDGAGGDDLIEGGKGADNLLGAEDEDQVFGAGGPDFIDLAGADTAGSEDRGFGGPGNDTIDAFDGNKDEVNCGKGTRDKVFFDKVLDTITRNCEIKRPNRSP